jgi:ATPase subunit of ABC transporter with duplicated ATPase domains
LPQEPNVTGGANAFDCVIALDQELAALREALQVSELQAATTPLAICRRDVEDETTVRTMLGCLRLPAGHVTRPIGTLSAGERSKVALVRLLLSPVNLLLLDEPTNHLEIEAIEAVQATLAQFPGAIVFVTHERLLLEALATNELSLRNRDRQGAVV